MGSGVAYGVFVARQIASVHIDIARFIIEVQDNDSTESAERLGIWTRKLSRALALNQPQINTYAAYLLGEVEEFRKAETERKKQYNDTERHGKTRKDNDSSLRKKESKKVKKVKKESKISFSDSEFFDFEKFKAALPEWSEQKCQHWWSKADGYSKANGGKYLDWIQAVKNWERSDVEKSAPKTKKPYNPLNP